MYVWLHSRTWHPATLRRPRLNSGAVPELHAGVLGAISRWSRDRVRAPGESCDGPGTILSRLRGTLEETAGPTLERSRHGSGTNKLRDGPAGDKTKQSRGGSRVIAGRPQNNFGAAPGGKYRADYETPLGPSGNDRQAWGDPWTILPGPRIYRGPPELSEKQRGEHKGGPEAITGRLRDTAVVSQLSLISFIAVSTPILRWPAVPCQHRACSETAPQRRQHNPEDTTRVYFPGGAGAIVGSANGEFVRKWRVIACCCCCG